MRYVTDTHPFLWYLSDDRKVIQKIAILRKLPDIHDRIIVASALLLGVPLITKDKNIKKSGYVNVIW